MSGAGRSLRGNGGDRRGGGRDDFDAVAEGGVHGLAPEVSREIWERVEREAWAADGRFHREAARRRFHQVAAKVARNGGRLRPDVGKVTRIEAELYGDGFEDPFADVAPGKVTRVEMEARRAQRRDPFLGIAEVSSILGWAPRADDAPAEDAAAPPTPAQRVALDVERLIGGLPYVQDAVERLDAAIRASEFERAIPRAVTLRDWCSGLVKNAREAARLGADHPAHAAAIERHRVAAVVMVARAERLLARMPTLSPDDMCAIDLGMELSAEGQAQRAAWLDSLDAGAAPGAAAPAPAPADRAAAPPPLVPMTAPVDVPHRARLEPVFGASFAHVRAHVGEAAALAPHGARGAAMPGAVVFAAAEPDLETAAHELAHVQQLDQIGADVAAPARTWSVRWDAAEVEADAVAHDVARGAASVRVSARPAAAVSFDTSPAPAAAGAPVPPDLSGVVGDALALAQEGTPFDVALVRGTTLAARVRDALAAHDALAPDVVQALGAGARRIGALPVTPALAGQPGTSAMTFDTFLTLLGQTFLSPELMEHGLPASFGNTVALGPIASEITNALDDALAAAAALVGQRAGLAPGEEARRLLGGSVDAALALHLPTIAAALTSLASAWTDPLAPLEHELAGAVAELVALRQQLGGDPTVGPQIARLARYVLLLSQALGPVKDEPGPGGQVQPGRQSRQKQRGGRSIVAPGSAALAEAAQTMQDLRALAAGDAPGAPRRPGAADPERETIEYLGDRADLLAPQAVTVLEGDGPPAATVHPEEAFPQATDALAVSGQETIAAQLAAQQTALAELRANVVPAQIESFAQFRQVYARWFGFLNLEERDQSMSYRFFQNMYQRIMPALAETGWRGWLFNAHMMNAGAGAMVLPGASTAIADGVGGGVGGAPIARQDGVADSALAPGYQTAEIVGGQGAGEVDSRRRWQQTQSEQQRAATKQIYGAKDRARAAVEGGMVPGDIHAPPRVRTLEASQQQQRDGTAYLRNGAGWHHFAQVVVADAVGRLQTVYEHKVMREEVVQYLLALMQHHETLRTPHVARQNGRALGDEAAASEGLEASTASATLAYGDRDAQGRADPTASDASTTARARIQGAQRAAFEGTNADPAGGRVAPMGGAPDPLQHATQQLIGDLEAAMTGYLAGVDPLARIGALVQIAATEYELTHAIWQQFEPKALWEMAMYSLKLAALMVALERMGPVGQLAARAIQQGLKWKHARESINLAVTFGVWVQNAITVSSFGQARRAAMPFVGFAEWAAGALTDWAEDRLGLSEKVRAGLGKAADTAIGTMPGTVGELGDTMGPHLTPASREQLVRELEAQLAPHLDARQPGEPLSPEAAQLWSMLHATDPAAAQRLRDRHDLPPVHLTDPIQAAGGAATPRETALRFEAERSRIEGDVHAQLGALAPDALAVFRVEVLSPEQFAARFRTSRGEAAVVPGPDGTAVLYTVPGISKAQLGEEAIHLAQHADPKHSRDAAMLSEAALGQWDTMDAATRADLYGRKLDLEVDAAMRIMEAAPPNSSEWMDAMMRMTALAQRRGQVAQLGEDQLTAMNADPSTAPDYLRDPSWLFSKTAGHEGTPLTTTQPDLAKLPARAIDDSPLANRPDTKAVVQRGDAWAETVTITASSGGRVERVEEVSPGKWKVTIGGRTYAMEGTPQVATGDIVTAGALLAVERTETRLVEQQKQDGTTDRRIEQKNAKGKWVQAGSESNFRGRVAEDASKAEIDRDRAAKQTDAEAGRAAGDAKAGYESHRLAHQDGSGQGFDDVVVEFHGQGDEMRAVIRIVEVKDYPDKGVPLAKFTAIRDEGGNLRENMTRLEVQLEKLAKGLPVAQREALARAMESNDYRVEIRLGPTTSMGKESAGDRTVLAQLRKELAAFFEGKDVLSTAEPENISPDAINEAIAATTARPENEP